MNPIHDQMERARDCISMYHETMHVTVLINSVLQMRKGSVLMQPI